MLFWRFTMKQYRRFLQSQYVADKELDHYLSWVEHYAQYCKDRALDYWDEKSLINYKRELGFRLAEWKVLQAEDAVKKYCYWRRGQSEERLEALISKLRGSLRIGKRSVRTEDCYVNWVRRFLKYNGKERGWVIQDIKFFITFIVSNQGVSAATQNQALAALSYFYKHVLEQDPGELPRILKAKSKHGLPVIFSHDELNAIFEQLTGTELLIAKLMYGAGLRSGESYQLRMHDLDFKKKVLLVRDRLGMVKRETIFPESLFKELKVHIKSVKAIYTKDQETANAVVVLPDEYEVVQDEAKQWKWFWLFPSPVLKIGSDKKSLIREHYHAWHLQHKFKDVLKSTGIDNQGNLDSLRHSFAVHMLEDGYDIRTVQTLLGHQDVKTTMVYSKLAKVGEVHPKSPLDKASESNS